MREKNLEKKFLETSNTNLIAYLRFLGIEQINVSKKTKNNKSKIFYKFNLSAGEKEIMDAFLTSKELQLLNFYKQVVWEIHNFIQK